MKGTIQLIQANERTRQTNYLYHALGGLRGNAEDFAPDELYKKLFILTLIDNYFETKKPIKDLADSYLPEQQHDSKDKLTKIISETEFLAAALSFPITVKPNKLRPQFDDEIQAKEIASAFIKGYDTTMESFSAKEKLLDRALSLGLLGSSSVKKLGDSEQVSEKIKVFSSSSFIEKMKIFSLEMLDKVGILNAIELSSITLNDIYHRNIIPALMTGVSIINDTKTKENAAILGVLEALPYVFDKSDANQNSFPNIEINTLMLGCLRGILDAGLSKLISHAEFKEVVNTVTNTPHMRHPALDLIFRRVVRQIESTHVLTTNDRNYFSFNSEFDSLKTMIFDNLSIIKDKRIADLMVANIVAEYVRNKAVKDPTSGDIYHLLKKVSAARAGGDHAFNIEKVFHITLDVLHGCELNQQIESLNKDLSVLASEGRAELTKKMAFSGLLGVGRYIQNIVTKFNDAKLSLEDESNFSKMNGNFYENLRFASKACNKILAVPIESILANSYIKISESSRSNNLIEGLYKLTDGNATNTLKALYRFAALAKETGEINISTTDLHSLQMSIMSENPDLSSQHVKNISYQLESYSADIKKLMNASLYERLFASRLPKSANREPMAEEVERKLNFSV